MQNIQKTIAQHDIYSHVFVDDDQMISKKKSDNEIVASALRSVNEDCKSDDKQDKSEEEVSKVTEALSTVKSLTLYRAMDNIVTS